jgi:hypothetical protein
MTLTDTQLVLLSAASQREDGAIVLTPNLKGSAAGKVIGKLLRDGLVEEVPAGALGIVDRVLLEQRSVLVDQIDAMEADHGSSGRLACRPSQPDIRT